MAFQTPMIFQLTDMATMGGKIKTGIGFKQKPTPVFIYTF